MANLPSRDDEAVDTVISIVNWRTAPLVIDCLRSLSDPAERPYCHVVVVDNDSGDGSLDQITSAIAAHGWSAWVRVIGAPTNGGFACGNNIAIRWGLGEYPRLRYVILLNPDTLVRSEAMALIRSFMDAHPDVGIAGGRSEDPDATPQHCCFRFPSMAGEFASYVRLAAVDRLLAGSVMSVGIPTEDTEVDWVSGGFMIVRREVIDSIGLMDEGYFLYFEETDFTLRARRAGWRCWHVPHSRVVHLVGQSSGVTLRDGRPRRLPAYWFDSRRRYFTLNHGRAYAVLTDLVAIVACASWRLRRRLQRKPDSDPPHFVRDLIRLGAISRGSATLATRKTGLQP